jgi:diguanylate cyclase (GGDEF)-like protein
VAYSRKAGPLVAAVAGAILVVSNYSIFATVGEAVGQPDVFRAVWQIALASSVAIIALMAYLFRRLAVLIKKLEVREASAQHGALHDQLTGLANRALLNDRLSQALARHHSAGEQLALMILDLDRFKQVNDTFGHNAGDKLVQEVGDRLRALLRETDTLARIGGDEFAIVMVGPKGEADVRRLCERIIQVIRKPFILGDREVRIGVSIGVVFASKAVAEAPDLLQKADITMYRAKSAGRDCFRIFTEAMDADGQRRDQIETQLRTLLGEGRGVELQFQPVVGGSGRVMGLEGVIRWDHPILGEIAPCELVQIAEECGAKLARP